MAIERAHGDHGRAPGTPARQEPPAEREHRAVGFRFTTRAGHPTFVDLPWEQPLTEWDTERLVAPVRGHLAPRRALRGLRARRLRPEGAARSAGRPTSTGCCARSTSGRCRWSRRSGWPPVARPATASRSTTSSSRTTSSTRCRTGRCSPGVARRPVGLAARRPGPAAGPGAPGRVLLGRLLAVEHAVPAGRRGAGRLAGRRRDRRAARPAVRRPARPRPRDRRDERGRRAARHHGRGPRRRAGDGADRRRPPRSTRPPSPRTCAAATTRCGTS